MTPQNRANDELAELDLTDLDLTGLTVVAMRDLVALPETGASISIFPSCIAGPVPSCSSVLEA